MKIMYKPGRETLLDDAMSQLNLIPCRSKGKLIKLKQAINEDPKMTALSEHIINGWPEKQRSLPQPLLQYLSCRDELTGEEGGVIMKVQRILIPQCGKGILAKLHDAHQSIVKCQLRAKSTVFLVKNQPGQ
ncbi:hypothetical protein HOLleu_10817 [Holothuria leucospilota]|uniref:Uncharacterized protein n=1 Tax=Holothuria leucospilota TaxID=206669 RepID=A0A9Q1CE26_HOLLE|nr:hypothetical protein HOLleu_10817 [Holothuria leucospilota]